MSLHDRRGFLRHGVWGLAAAGTGSLMLRADAQPTPESGRADEYLAFLQQEAPTKQLPGRPLSDSVVTIPEPALPEPLAATEENILGPYYRAGAPYRAKITPVLEPGTPLVIRGRVWGLDTKRPLAGVTLDVWQANAEGRYDNDDPKAAPAKGVYLNRARLLTDETGYYEFESVHPGRYQIGPEAWRPSHIHYLVQHAGYKRLVTQLYFKGDPMNAQDQFIRPSLTIELETLRVGAKQQTVEMGVFDIVLAKR